MKTQSIITVLTDGTTKQVNTLSIPDRLYIKALSLGIAELVHLGELKIDDIRAEPSSRSYQPSSAN